MSEISLRLPDEISERLNQLTKRTGRTKTYYIMEAIREHLDDLEDLYLSEQALLRIRSGQDEMISLVQAMAEYGLERKT